MAEFWRTKSFKALSLEWNKKLEASGFSDAEVELKRGGRALKKRATNDLDKMSEFQREAKLEYYCFVGYLAHNTLFSKEVDKTVMMKHSEGLSCKEIAKAIGRHRHYVEFIIKRWQTKWGIKSWSLQARGLKK